MLDIRYVSASHLLYVTGITWVAVHVFHRDFFGLNIYSVLCTEDSQFLTKNLFGTHL